MHKVNGIKADLIFRSSGSECLLSRLSKEAPVFLKKRIAGIIQTVSSNSCFQHELKSVT